MANPRALIVDDEPDLCELLSLTLARMNVDSSSVHDLVSARAQLQGRESFALCLTDLRLPDGDGLDLVEWIQVHAPDLPVAVITAHGHIEAAVRALKLGAFDFVSKPLDVTDLRKLVNQALKLSDGRRPGAADRRLLGTSQIIQMPDERPQRLLFRVRWRPDIGGLGSTEISDEGRVQLIRFIAAQLALGVSFYPGRINDTDLVPTPMKRISQQIAIDASRLEANMRPFCPLVV
jgi:FixJ family two-component response regulator